MLNHIFKIVGFSWQKWNMRWSYDIVMLWLKLKFFKTFCSILISLLLQINFFDHHLWSLFQSSILHITLQITILSCWTSVSSFILVQLVHRSTLVSLHLNCYPQLESICSRRDSNSGPYSLESSALTIIPPLFGFKSKLISQQNYL